MRPPRALWRLRAIALIVAVMLAPCIAEASESTVTIGVVNDFAGWDPYADSTAQMYMIWCQTYGCLGTFNTNTGEYEPLLAQSWESDKNDSRIWYSISDTGSNGTTMARS